jgi:NADH:ubiquinone oxidoreductase subunit H
VIVGAVFFFGGWALAFVPNDGVRMLAGVMLYAFAPVFVIAAMNEIVARMRSRRAK